MRYLRYLTLVGCLRILFIKIIDYILIIFKFAIVQVILFKILIKTLLFHPIFKIVVNEFKGENLFYYLFDLTIDSNILQ